MRFRRNPDINELGIHLLTAETMWWASKGPCELQYVPAFRGLGSAPLPKQEDYAPEDWRDIQRNWDAMVKEFEFLRWMEDLFEEVRKQVQPEAPSRIGNIIVCPKLGVGFCRQPSDWEINYPTQRNHVYRIEVTGVAATLNSEEISTARQYAADELTEYGGGWTGRPRDFAYWQKDAVRMREAEDVIRSVARRYWLPKWDCQEGLKETLVQGTGRIIELALIAGGRTKYTDTLKDEEVY